MIVTTPAAFEDSSGTIQRLTGELEFLGAATAGEVLTVDVGGKTASFQAVGVSTAREQLTGNAVNIANAASASLTWDTKSSGSDLLDLTDPANPVAVAAGIYAVTVEVHSAAITAAGFYSVTLALDTAGDNAAVAVLSPASATANTTPLASCSLTYYVPAGGVFNVTVQNEDGASSVDFTLASAVVQAI